MEVPAGFALVEFTDHPGVRVVGRLRGFDLGGVTIGAEVDLSFEPGADGTPVPAFRPAGSAT